ncbi:MAG: hypothetical protein WC877_01450 [Dehalococcoidales bacterium]|jgi:hypothetical protein
MNENDNLERALEVIDDLIKLLAETYNIASESVEIIRILETENINLRKEIRMLKRW